MTLVEINTKTDEEFLKNCFDTSWICYRDICEKKVPYVLEYDEKQEILSVVNTEDLSTLKDTTYTTIQELEKLVFST